MEVGFERTLCYEVCGVEGAWEWPLRIFTYCKQSKTGGGNGLGTRLCYNHAWTYVLVFLCDLLCGPMSQMGFLPLRGKVVTCPENSRPTELTWLQHRTWGMPVECSSWMMRVQTPKQYCMHVLHLLIKLGTKSCVAIYFFSITQAGEN